MVVGRVTSEEAAANRDGFVERVFSSALATFDIFSIYIGDRLGLYAALQEKPSTAKVLFLAELRLVGVRRVARRTDPHIDSLSQVESNRNPGQSCTSLSDPNRLLSNRTPLWADLEWLSAPHRKYGQHRERHCALVARREE